MPREQLKSLAADVDRLLAAGGSNAAADEGLRQRAKALRALGAKVPALVPIAAASERVARSDAGAAPRALLDLLLVVRQVQAGLATAGVAGPLVPVEPSGPWTTTASGREVAEVAAVMAKAGSGIVEALKDAVDRRVLPDLRLLGRLLKLLEGSAVVAEAVAEEVLPAFGAAVVPELRRGLFGQDEPRASDGLRLLAIGKIDPGLGVELSRQALAGEGAVKRRGMPTVRRALELLAEHAPEEAERIALELLAPKSGTELRAAVFATLGGMSSAALEALIAALLGDEEGWIRASTALMGLPHPGTTDRLIREIEAARARVEAGRAAAKGKGEDKGRARAATKVPGPRDAEVPRLLRLIHAVEYRGDRRAAGALVPLLNDPAADVREAAVKALTEVGEPEHLEAAAALLDDEDCWRAAVRAAWRLPPAACYERLAPLCAALATVRGAARDRAYAVVELFDEEMGRRRRAGDDPCGSGGQAQFGSGRTVLDPRWVELLGRLFDGPRRDEVALALAVAGGRAVVPRLIGALGPSLEQGSARVSQALVYLKAREAVAPLLDLAASRPKTFSLSDTVLRDLCRPSDLPALEALLARTKDPYVKSSLPRLIKHVRSAASDE